jgi:GntP family gluconate:H+ symporter
VIILITAAGGMFGAALQEAGVGGRIQALASSYQIAVLPLAFFVTALIRTAQGSATVAMITAAGILQGFAASPAALGFHPVYLALAIGCGSKPFPWMNDSGFWVIGRMSGMTEAETLKTSSTMMALMGCAGLVVVLVLAKLVPMPVG